MSSLQERRKALRYDCTGCIRFTRLHQEKSNRGAAIDCSEEGLRFQSDFELKPGSSVLIRMESVRMNLPATAGKIAVRSVALAEVKWCRILQDLPEAVYTTGVKFFLPE